MTTSKVKPVYSKVKVLPHTVYLQHKSGFREERMLEELNDYHKEITPVFNRTGEYLLGDKCWFEVRGRAFKKRKKDFLYELRQCEMADTDIELVRKLVDIRKSYPRMLSKKQSRLIMDYGHFLSIRGMKRNSMKRLKEWKAELLVYKDRANELPKVQ